MELARPLPDLPGARDPARRGDARDRRRPLGARADEQGYAVFTWFAGVLGYDLVLLGVLVGAGIAPGVLTLLLVANPVDAGRVLVVLALEPDLYLLGPAGAWLLAELGSAGAAALLVGSLLAWGGAALATALWLFRGPRLAKARSMHPRFRLPFALDLHSSNTDPEQS